MDKRPKHFRWRFIGTRGLSSETYQEFIERRFWSKVEKSDGCWLWTAGIRRNQRGNDYGQFVLRGQNVSAHRMSLMLQGVILGDGDVVAHHCDNPRCVRPDHLFVTTQQGNTADRHAKGRTASHERNGNAKLSDADVAMLRDSYAQGVRVTDIAAQWKISREHVWRLCSQKQRRVAGS